VGRSSYLGGAELACFASGARSRNCWHVRASCIAMHGNSETLNLYVSKLDINEAGKFVPPLHSDKSPLRAKIIPVTTRLRTLSIRACSRCID
jgi:hypothetical protein